MSYQIIVARYNEPIEWLNSELDHCVFYNKGNDTIPNQISLPNVGRESETYLNYIISNYDSLPDVVVFTQARISDHLNENNVRILIDKKNQALLNQTGKSNPSIITPSIPHTSWAQNNHWGPQWNLDPVTNTYYLEDNYKDNNKMTYYEWFCRHINPIYPDPIHVYVAAIFAVKKECILKKSKEYYEELIKQVNHHSNPAEGHFFERSWFYIFS